MSLFVGNISRKVDIQDIETAFREFGSCRIEFRVQIEVKNKEKIRFRNLCKGQRRGRSQARVKWERIRR